MDECRKESEELWVDGKPKKWYYALPIVVLWAFILYLIVKAIFLWEKIKQGSLF